MKAVVKLFGPNYLINEIIRYFFQSRFSMKKKITGTLNTINQEVWEPLK